MKTRNFAENEGSRSCWWRGEYGTAPRFHKKGLPDSRLDDNFRIEHPKEENPRAIVDGLRFLASKLDD